MIVLNEICEKLNKILNGLDGEANNINSNRPTDFEFVVNTPGFHITKVTNEQTKKNFIPVFISSLGGQYNPVPQLKQSDATVPIVFYYPVRFKNDFFALQDWLVDVLVGQNLTWGDISGKAISNLSLPRFGEIQDLDLQQFKSWVNQNYNRPIEVMEPFITMEIALYLSSAADGFIFGNSVKITKLAFYTSGNSTAFLEDTNPVCIERADIGTCEPASQQTFDDTHAKGYAASASYSRQLPLVIKDLPGYYTLVELCEKSKNLQNIKVEITEEIPLHITETINGEQVTHTLAVTHSYFITNYSRRTTLGQLLGVNLTLADLREDEEEEE